MTDNKFSPFEDQEPQDSRSDRDQGVDGFGADERGQEREEGRSDGPDRREELDRPAVEPLDDAVGDGTRGGDGQKR